MAVAAVLVVSPAVLRAQEEDIDFLKARREFVAGQARAAANSLLMASLGVRQQVGRCRDVNVGTELLNAESNLEKLASALRAGTVKDVKTLDVELTRIDRYLAHHHLLLVKEVQARPRADNIPTAVRDLDRLAFHLERSFTLNGQKPNAEQAQVIAEARQLSEAIGKSNALPATTAAFVATAEKLFLALETPPTP
jgi:hypothetical protein